MLQKQKLVYMNVRSLNSLNNRPDDSTNQINLRNNQPVSFFDGFDPLTAQNIKAAEQHKVLFVSGNLKMKNPKDQNYFDMLKSFCCPMFNFCSFTTVVLITTLAVYLAELSLGLDKKASFLQVKSTTLLKLGANSALLIRQGQVYRLIAPIFLHINFLHFFGNMLAIFMFATRLEYSFGFIRIFLIYILSGIGGNIVSALADPQSIKAGASTSLFGVIGVIFGYMAINCRGIKVIGPILRCQFVCTSINIFFFILFFSVLSSSNVDTYGHLGGLLTGFLLSSINSTILNQKYQKIIRIVFFSLFLIEYIVCFTLFFTKPL